MPEDKLIEAMARALWLESAHFPSKEAHWDVPGLMLDIDREPYFALARSALAAIEQEGYVVVPQAPDKIMIEKGLTAIQDNMDSTRDTYGSYDYAVEGTAYHCYVAMLAATKDPSNA